jgi:hypothetical protein
MGGERRVMSNETTPGRVIRLDESRPARTVRPENAVHAAKTLEGTSYLAYSLVQACKLFIKLIERRWPEAS